jgi:hypothetical protein
MKRRSADLFDQRSIGEISGDSPSCSRTRKFIFLTRRAQCSEKSALKFDGGDVVLPEPCSASFGPASGGNLLRLCCWSIAA